MTISRIVKSCIGALTLLSMGGMRLAGQSTAAFTGLTLIDGTTRPPVANATLVVRDGRILAAGPAATTRIPNGARQVPLDGMFVIPGLIDAHGHVSGPADLSTYAAYGITTVFSLGGEPASVFAARAAQDTPALNRSRVYLAGPVLAPTTADEARTQVANAAAQKVDIIKIRVDDMLGTTRKMTPDVYRAVISEAHARGLRVAVHMYYMNRHRRSSPIHCSFCTPTSNGLRPSANPRVRRQCAPTLLRSDTRHSCRLQRAT